MKNKNGFTLIELLAVIVILAVIAVIATPIILGIIDDSKKESFKDSAYGIIDAAKMVYMNESLNGATEKISYTYTNGVETSTLSGSVLNYSGAKPTSGEVRIDTSGSTSMAIYDGTYCATKGYDESSVTVSKKTQVECVIPTSIVLTYMHPYSVNQTCNPSSLTATCTSQINLFPSSNTPAGYVKCNGAVVDQTTYADLYSLIGVNYGGNGITNFAIPNLTAATPLSGLSYFIATSNLMPNWSSSPTGTRIGDYKYFTYRTSYSNFIVGQVLLISEIDGTTDKYLPCDGRTLNPSSYATLFNKIGVTFGGNGISTFALPNLSSATSPVAGASYYMVVK